MNLNLLHRDRGAHAADERHPTEGETVDGYRDTDGYRDIDGRDTDGDGRVEHTRVVREETGPTPLEEAHEKFGGANLGACFFGWIVATGVAILLTGVVGAVLAAIGSQSTITQDQAQRQAGTIGLAAAITLVVVLMIGYYAGGYVAGRMSRFDGARQGATTWVIGLVVTLVAIGLGALFGDQYNVLDRVSLPRIPVSTSTMGWGALITAVVVLAGTLLAAIAGGSVGRRYHSRVDRVARLTPAAR